MKNENWKPINGYEKLYEVSDLGRIKSLDRTIYFKNNKGCRTLKGKILKFKYLHGYAMINLHKYGEVKNFLVHRIVAEHFILNTNNKPIINHIDGIKTNNKIDNLEWCTYSENNKHAILNNLTKNNIEGLLKYNNLNKKALICLNNKNEIIHISSCSNEMSKFLIDLNITESKNVKSVARAIRRFTNENKTYYKFKFIFIPELLDIKNYDSLIIIYQNDNIINISFSSEDCSKFLLKNNLINEVKIETVSRAIRKIVNSNKTYKNFSFKKYKIKPVQTISLIRE